MRFFVPGEPQPQGSKKSIQGKNQKFPVMVEDARKSRPWRSDVKFFASQAMSGRPLLEGPLHLELVFVFPRPKGHYGTGRNAGKLKPRAPKVYTSSPDRDKLERCVCDALTGVVWIDDRQNAIGGSAKLYGSRPGVFVEVRPIRQKDLPQC